jgi:hypothetical protein
MFISQYQPVIDDGYRDSLYAITESETGMFRDAGPPPAAAMTTYCAPSLPM